MADADGQPEADPGAYPELIECYVCDDALEPRNMPCLSGVQDRERKNGICTARRADLGLPPAPIEDETRVCLNCNMSMGVEINYLNTFPDAPVLQVLAKTSGGSCFICHQRNNELVKLSTKYRVKIYLETGIYAPFQSRCWDLGIHSNFKTSNPVFEVLKLEVMISPLVA